MIEQSSLDKLEIWIQNQLTPAEAKNRGLIPKSGNWDKPYRWTKEKKSSNLQFISTQIDDLLNSLTEIEKKDVKDVIIFNNQNKVQKIGDNKHPNENWEEIDEETYAGTTQDGLVIVGERVFEYMQDLPLTQLPFVVDPIVRVVLHEIGHTIWRNQLSNEYKLKIVDEMERKKNIDRMSSREQKRNKVTPITFISEYASEFDDEFFCENYMGYNTEAGKKWLQNNHPEGFNLIEEYYSSIHNIRKQEGFSGTALDSASTFTPTFGSNGKKKKKQEELEKQLSPDEAKARGLVPKSGNWEKPYRWVRGFSPSENEFEGVNFSNKERSLIYSTPGLFYSLLDILPLGSTITSRKRGNVYTKNLDGSFTIGEYTGSAYSLFSSANLRDLIGDIKISPSLEFTEKKNELFNEVLESHEDDPFIGKFKNNGNAFTLFKKLSQIKWDLNFELEPTYGDEDEEEYKTVPTSQYKALVRNNKLPNIDIFDLIGRWKAGPSIRLEDNKSSWIKMRSLFYSLFGIHGEMKSLEEKFFIDEHRISKESFNRNYNKKIEDEELSLIPFMLMTQQYLKKRFPSGHATIYRGIHSNLARNVRAELQDKNDVRIPHGQISSYSLDKTIAEAFSKRGKDGIILSKKIPVFEILLTLDLFFDSGEDEIFVDGNKINSFSREEIITND